MTLIAPAELSVGDELEQVGELTRTETEFMVIGYFFDMRSNRLIPETARNPSAGREHHFAAYKMKGAGSGPVTMRNVDQDPDTPESGDEE